MSFELTHKNNWKLEWNVFIFNTEGYFFNRQPMKNGGTREYTALLAKNNIANYNDGI